MNGAGASHLCSAVGASAKPRQVGGRGGRDAAFGPSLGQTASGAAPVDLWCSSKYSNVNFDDRSGEMFHGNSSWTWVSATPRKWIRELKHSRF